MEVLVILNLSTLDTTIENFGQTDELLFSEWDDGSDLKLSISFANKDEFGYEDTILATDKYDLTTNITFTPTPTMVILGRKFNATPTPLETSELSSWFKFDFASLNVIADEINFLLLSNLQIIDENKPSFLGNNYDYEIIAFTIVKRSYSSARLSDSFTDSVDAFAYSSVLLECDNGIPTEGLGEISSFEDFKNKTGVDVVEDWGSLNFSRLTFMDFEDWREDEELDLIILFGGGRHGEDARFWIQDRFQMFLNDAPTTDLNMINGSLGMNTPTSLINTTKTSGVINTEPQFINEGYSTTLNADGNVFASASRINTGFTGSNQEKVNVYANQNGNWNQLGDSVYNAEPDEGFGKSIALNLDGSLLVVGSLTQKISRWGCQSLSV